MVIQWFLCTTQTYIDGEAVTTVRPCNIVDTIIVDGIEIPKYTYIQWSAVYYPQGVSQLQYVHALIRVEAVEPLVMHDGIDCIEIITTEDWVMVHSIYPDLRKHWSDQPGVV